MRLPEESDEAPFFINLVSMIDVLFCILAFFIISSLYLTRSEGFSVNLPQAATGETQRTTQINLTIQANGQMFLNRQLITIETLEQAVRGLVANNSQSLVIINADASVPHGQVVSAMDRLRQIQGVKLAIATQKP
jgi:biopolymer transport protein ExbD